MLSVLAVWPARPSVETHPVAEVRAGREDRGHAHVDQKGLPVSQRLVLLLRRWRRLPLGRTCPGGPPSHFSVLTRAEEWEGQRWVTRSEDNNGKDAVTRALPGRSEPHVSSLVMLTLVRCPLVTNSPRGPGGPHGQGRGLRRTTATAVSTGAHFAPAPAVRCSHQIRKGNGGAHLLPHSPRAPRQMLTHRARVTADTTTPHVPAPPCPPGFPALLQSGLEDVSQAPRMQLVGRLPGGEQEWTGVGGDNAQCSRPRAVSGEASRGMWAHMQAAPA